MYIQGVTLLEFISKLTPATLIDVRHEDGKDLAFSADPARIRELATANQIAGIATSSRLRYAILRVPIAATVQIPNSERSHGGCVAEDSRTVERGRDLSALVYSHDYAVCGTWGGSAKAHRQCGAGIRS